MELFDKETLELIRNSHNPTKVMGAYYRLLESQSREAKTNFCIKGFNEGFKHILIEGIEL